MTATATDVSSVAAAGRRARVRIQVDWDLCQGHGVCRAEAPEVFDVDADQARVVVLQESPPEERRAKVQAAVNYCPTRALSLED